MSGAAALAALTGAAQAQQVRFQGSTLGCFHGSLTGPAAASGTPCALGASSSLAGSIEFDAGSFDVFTDPAGSSGPSYGAIGNVLATNSLGTVASTGTAFSATGDQFLRLRIAFATPTHTTDVPTNGTPSLQRFDVDYQVSGSSQAPGIGGIDFVPVGGPVMPSVLGIPGLVFDAVNGVVRTGNFYTGGFTSGDVSPPGPGGGSAAGTIDDHPLDTRSVTAGGTSSLTSFLQISSNVTSVPEPATVALMGAGVLGLVGARVVRRRSRI